MYIAASGAGTLLFVANQGSDNISVFQVGSGGVLTAASGSPFASIAASPAAIATNF